MRHSAVIVPQYINKVRIIVMVCQTHHKPSMALKTLMSEVNVLDVSFSVPVFSIIDSLHKTLNTEELITYNFCLAFRGFRSFIMPTDFPPILKILYQSIFLSFPFVCHKNYTHPQQHEIALKLVLLTLQPHQFISHKNHVQLHYLVFYIYTPGPGCYLITNN